MILCASAQVARAQNGLRDRDRSFAASQQIANDLRKSRFHYGPFYFLTSLQLSDVGYESGFYVPTADTTSGFAFGIQAPTRLYLVPRKKTIYSVEVVPEWSYLRRKGNQNVFGYRARVDAQYLLNHLYLDFHAQTADQLRADVAEIARLVNEQSRAAGLDGELKYSSRTSMTFMAQTRKNKHPANDLQPSFLPVQLLDRSEHDYRLTLNHKTFPLTALFLAAEYSGYSFSDAVFKNGRRTYAGAGFAYDSGKTVTHFEAGPARLDFERADQHDFRGVLGNITSTRKLGRSVSAHVNAARDVDFSVFAFNNYYIADRFSVGTEWDVTRRLQLTAQSSIGQDLYDTPVNGLKRKDRFSFTSVGWTYGLARLRGGFDIGYVKRTSNFNVNLDDGIRLLLRLSFTP
jgi:hypothetical protein